MRIRSRSRLSNCHPPFLQANRPPAEPPTEVVTEAVAEVTTETAPADATVAQPAQPRKSKSRSGGRRIPAPSVTRRTKSTRNRIAAAKSLKRRPSPMVTQPRSLNNGTSVIGRTASLIAPPPSRTAPSVRRASPSGRSIRIRPLRFSARSRRSSAASPVDGKCWCQNPHRQVALACPHHQDPQPGRPAGRNRSGPRQSSQDRETRPGSRPRRRHHDRRP